MAQASKVAVAVLKTNPLLPELSFLRLRKYLQNPEGGRRRPQIPARVLLWALLVGQVLRQNCFHALEALVRSPASRNLPVSASFSDDCPSRKFHAGQCGSLIFKTNRRVNRFAAVPESDERNSLMCTTQRDSLGTNFKGPRRCSA